jgi:hypothetical protein
MVALNIDLLKRRYTIDKRPIKKYYDMFKVAIKG